VRSKRVIDEQGGPRVVRDAVDGLHRTAAPLRHLDEDQCADQPGDLVTHGLCGPVAVEVLVAEHPQVVVGAEVHGPSTDAQADPARLERSTQRNDVAVLGPCERRHRDEGGDGGATGTGQHQALPRQPCPRTQGPGSRHRRLPLDSGVRLLLVGSPFYRLRMRST
jgi:hypothetical protein